VMDTKSKAVFDYIFSLTYPGVKLELSRVEHFMTFLGNPHEAYPVVHIAGTNGKGSTGAMLAAILNAYGIKTGLFTSPHLVRANERIRINDHLIPDDFIIQKVQAWRPQIEDLGITFFEVLTALGMVYFKEQEVDYAVFETGLGGRLDATNVVDPVVSVITAVSLDHENILGNSLELIAAEKAGIIKTGKPLILGKNSKQVRDIMDVQCRARRSSCTYVPDAAEIVEITTVGTSQEIKIAIADRVIETVLPFMGLHQVENYCNVLVTLNELGLELNPELIQNGLDQMNWGGRMQPLQMQPLVLYDVAHNPEGLERLLESLRRASLADAILIAGFNARKNIQTMLNSLEAWEGPVIFSLYLGHSAIEYDDLIRLGVEASLVAPSLEKAYQRAIGLRNRADQTVCFFGSHYLAESLYELFEIK